MIIPVYTPHTKFTDILLKTNFASDINMHVCFFYWADKIENNIHLEQPFYLLTKTWKYGGSVFGTDFAGGD